MMATQGGSGGSGGFLRRSHVRKQVFRVIAKHMGLGGPEAEKTPRSPPSPLPDYRRHP
jgi:hypothetical protein